MMRTLGREIISTRQEKLAKLARIEPKRVLTTLAHHIDELWRRKLQGHYAYYGITGNARALGHFLHLVAASL
jgi:hypothetical protein